MRTSSPIIAALLLLSCAAVSAQQATPTHALSAVELRIASARKKLKATPDAQSYNDLAVALSRKARDTADPIAYDEEAAALKHSLELTPGNYDALKLQAALELATGRYPEALKRANELNHKVPDDIANWGLLVDANMAFGNYAEAEHDAQWILDLRSGSALGFEKAAALREVFGDPTGSIEFYDEANRRTSPNDADQHAWYLTRKADLELASGSTRQAEEVINQALQLFPDSQLAAVTLARIRAAQGRYDEAASLLETRYNNVKTPQNLYAWAEALEKTSHPERAASLFGQFEAKAKAESNQPGNANVELISYYLSRGNEPAKALSLATARSLEYHDCRTLDLLAWSLYSNGKYPEAKTQLDRALAVGVRNPVYFCHGVQIAAKLNDTAGTQQLKKDLADFGPNACPAETGAVAMDASKR